MNRPLRPTISLAAAIAFVATAATARAADQQPAADPKKAALGPVPAEVAGAAQADGAAGAAAAAAPAGDVQAEVKEPSADDGGDSVPTRLKPGAIDEEEADDSRFPVGFAVSLGNSVGVGVLPVNAIAGGSANAYVPSLGTSLTLRPSFSIPTFDVLPRMSLSGSLDMGIDWLSTAASGPVGDRVVRLSDFVTALSFPAVFKEDFTNISLSPTLSVRLPLSLNSRFGNNFGGVGLSLATSWAAPELPMGLGQIRVTYTPAGRVNGFTRPAPTVPCGTDLPDFLPITPGTDPANGIDDNIPTFAFRSAEYLGDGTCVVAGRQTLASVSNSGAASWSFLEKHTVAVSFSHAISFRRPLRDDPSLKGLNAVSGLQNDIGDQMSGSISYSYAIPLDIAPDLSLSAGLQSQPGYSMAGYARVPFLDLFETRLYPNNLTSAFLSLDASI